MATGVLLLMLVLLAFLLGAFIYQIITTPLAAVDAPTLARSAAASATAAAPAPPHVPAASGPAHGAAAPRAADRMPSWSPAALAVGGLVAVVIGGGLFVRIAHGAAACSPRAIEVCSQGFVLLTGTQLAGGAIALAGIISIAVAIALALR
jgi:hypothetical protein